MSDFEFYKLQEGRASVGFHESTAVTHRFLMTLEDVQKNILTYGQDSGLLAAKDALSAASVSSGSRDKGNRINYV